MKKIFGLILGVALVLITSTTASAAEEEKNGTGADFGVSAIYPENQLNGQNGYFDLRMKPSDKQTVQVEVNNYSDKDITIKVGRNRATTGDGGIPEYKDIKKEKDGSLKVDFDRIAKLEESTIKLTGKESKKVSLNLSMPKDSFDGQVLGGIHFEQVDERKENEKDTNKMIEHKFSYSIAVLLTENDEKIENSLALVNVKPDQRNYRNFIEALIQNKAPMMIKDMSIEAKIYKENQDEAVYEANNGSLRMAPNSSFNYGIDLKDTKLIAGEYNYVLKVVADKKEYRFTKKFTIDKEIAQKLNKQSVNIEEEKSIWPLYLVGVSLMVIIFVIVGISIHHRKIMKEKRMRERRRRRKIKKNKKKINESKNLNK